MESISVSGLSQTIRLFKLDRDTLPRLHVRNSNCRLFRITSHLAVTKRRNISGAAIKPAYFVKRKLSRIRNPLWKISSTVPWTFFISKSNETEDADLIRRAVELKDERARRVYRKDKLASPNSEEVISLLFYADPQSERWKKENFKKKWSFYPRRLFLVSLFESLTARKSAFFVPLDFAKLQDLLTGAWRTKIKLSSRSSLSREGEISQRRQRHYGR